MTINLFIKENRKVEIKEKEIGVVGDNNATTLVLKYSSGVPQGNKVIIFNNKNGNFSYDIIEDRIEIPKKVTTEEQLNFWIEISDEDSTWYSEKVKVKLHEGVKESKNILDELIKEGIEECRSELETSLETATGENYDGKTWDELNNTVAELPIISEEQTQALGDWDLIKDYFADYAGNNHELFKAAPTDENGNARRYSLPYLYTPKMRWAQGRSYISTAIEEMGVDVSSAVNLGEGVGANTFSALPNLKRLVLTGNKNSPSLKWGFYQNYALQYLKMETPSEDVLSAYGEYYTIAFSGCKELITLDCELDFTGQTSSFRMFEYCTKLQHLRIKPFSLSISLDLGACQMLHISFKDNYESLISILNGITRDKEVAKNITLIFSSAITDVTQGMVQYWNTNVLHCDNGMFYGDMSEVPEGMACLEMSLYEAFISKGVTIAWK